MIYKKQFAETEFIELKKSTSSLKEAIISIAAILNKHQKGELYFGIKNDGTIIGQQVSEQTLRSISQAMSDNIDPKIYPDIAKITLEGKTCIRIAFQGNEPPYYANGRAYIRVGDENKQLSAKELENMILKKNESKLRWDNQYSDIKITDINKEILKNYIERSKEAARISFDFKTVTQTLKKLHLIKNNKILNAGQLLFCVDNPLEIQAAVFAGVEKTTFLDIKVFKGSLFDLLRQSELYIAERMNWRVEFKEYKRVEIPEIPADAIREALVNSLCHRDYFRAESNKIAIFKDRIKIYNPGEFPAGYEPEDFIKKDIEAIHRNPLIAELLYCSKDIEKWGTGMRRIYKDCTANKVKVEFQKETGGFSTIFYRPTEQHFNHKGTDRVTVKVTVYQKSILDNMLKNPHTTALALSKSIGISERKIKENIKKLKAQGFIKRVGSDKNGYWELIKD